MRFWCGDASAFGGITYLSLCALGCAWRRESTRRSIYLYIYYGWTKWSTWDRYSSVSEHYFFPLRLKPSLACSHHPYPYHIHRYKYTVWRRGPIANVWLWWWWPLNSAVMVWFWFHFYSSRWTLHFIVCCVVCVCFLRVFVGESTGYIAAAPPPLPLPPLTL